MRILFTGASCFTGLWFVEALSAEGHEVVATFTRRPAAYDDGTVGASRVARVANLCECVYDVRFGDSKFMSLLGNGEPYDVLCHHGAAVGDYHSPDFDVLGAVGSNTHELAEVLEILSSRGGNAVVLTGSVFEKGEGAGSREQKSVSPYGVSKALTADLFRFYADRAGVQLRKFVIPNPFGPFEEPRFTAYLMQQWLTEKAATVRTPAYVRDNIHVRLLAAAYSAFVSSPASDAAFLHFAPSGYVQSQGEFAERIARQMRDRLELPCGLELLHQTEFPEPRKRINTDPLDARVLRFDEIGAWDGLADYYRERLAR